MVPVIELRKKKESKKYKFNNHTVLKYSKKIACSSFCRLTGQCKILNIYTQTLGNAYVARSTFFKKSSFISQISVSWCPVAERYIHIIVAEILSPRCCNLVFGVI